MKYCSYKIGTIIEISDIENDDKNKFVTIAKNPKDIYSFTRLVVTEQTLILCCEYNEISVDELKIGDTVLVYHSNAMTMSIPPQTTAFIIEVK